ncbi:MAG TPA: cob(I)yrinic acid a,c-diamide adenosyltransferase [Rectinemataceae bacterium]|nr:cob(I)yrinic acid a,c-diamide adenosyltransferase [Rectinemataceae bacterium]
MDKGYFQVYTGEGKGKTTAALGLCLRALGAGLRVYLGQFIKGGRYSEIKALETLAVALDGTLAVRQFGLGRFIRNGPSPEDMAAAREGLVEARAALVSGDWDLVVLDELNVAAHVGLVTEHDIIDLAAARHPGVELLVTGRYATPAVIEAADLVTEMRPIRHYFDKGVMARKGIES